jgi:hypothetical protein
VVPPESVGENFVMNFPGITVPSTTDIHKLKNKVRSTESLLDKKPVKKRRVLTEEKLRNKGWKRTDTTEITETPCTRDRHLQIVSSRNDEAVNLNLFKWYIECAYTGTSFSASLIKR